MKRKATDVLADVFIYVFMAVLSLLCLIPFIHVLSVSISGNGAVMSNQVFLIPKDVNLDAYKTVFGDATMMRSLWFTLFVTVRLRHSVCSLQYAVRLHCQENV